MIDWKCVGISLAGTSHAALAIPCQDAHAWGKLPPDGIVLAIADGAGSATHSDIASRMVVKKAIDEISQQLPSLMTNNAISMRSIRKSFYRTFRKCRELLNSYAALHKIHLYDLSTTLALVVANENMIAGAHIGDGAIVFRCDSSLEMLTQPYHGEYVNHTAMLTTSHYFNHVQFRLARRSVDAIALLTDGLEFLTIQNKKPFKDFFNPLFKYLEKQSPEDTYQELHRLLQSPLVCHRTDDDITLLTTVPAK